MNSCYVCQRRTVKLLLDFGLQPISNRFLRFSDEFEFKHSLVLGYCENCGLVQLINPPKSSQVKSKFDWIKYSEPEGHLDNVVEKLINLSGITKESVFCGIGGQELSTLDRLNRKGFLKTWQLNIESDLYINDSLANVETIQQELTFEMANKIVEKRGKANVVIARYLLEHAHNPLQLMHALQAMLEPGGYVVFEVPDATRAFQVCDYNILWEEHIVYFTPHSFLFCLEQGNFEVCVLDNYKYMLENAMVAIARKRELNLNYTLRVNPVSINIERDRAVRYASQYLKQCQYYRTALEFYARKGGVALFGAGHMACHFINLMQVYDLINFVVDDNPNKSGMYMPGSRLPILTSDALEKYSIKLCLLSLSQDSERRVLQSKKEFTEKGGQFRSIFLTSEHSLLSGEVNEVDKIK